jgi:hypothetical protein
MVRINLQKDFKESKEKIIWRENILGGKNNECRDLLSGAFLPCLSKGKEACVFGVK